MFYKNIKPKYNNNYRCKISPCSKVIINLLSAIIFLVPGLAFADDCMNFDNFYPWSNAEAAETMNVTSISYYGDYVTLYGINSLSVLVNDAEVAIWYLPAGVQILDLEQFVNFTIHAGDTIKLQFGATYSATMSGDFTLTFCETVDTGTISGRLTDSMGTPIGGVWVQTWTDSCNGDVIPGKGSLSDTNGNYTIQNVLTGTFYIQANPANKGTSTNPTEYIDEWWNYQSR